MAFSSDCPLCVPDHDTLLWQDDRLRIVHVNDSPYPGYLRVVWQRHVAEMTDIDALDRLHLMRAVFQVERLQRDALRPDKINLASLGNQVPHLHWHLIPRWRGDPCFPDAIWAPPRHDAVHVDAWTNACAMLAPRVERLHRLLAAHGPAAELHDTGA
jgi:diadenosine tetraphosphate (Ap4A) HIT family hydrolase